MNLPPSSGVRHLTARAIPVESPNSGWKDSRPPVGAIHHHSISVKLNEWRTNYATIARSYLVGCCRKWVRHLWKMLHEGDLID